MNHTSGTILPCCVCGKEVRGVWHTPELLSEETGCKCAGCKKALEKFEESRKRRRESIWCDYKGMIDSQGNLF